MDENVNFYSWIKLKTNFLNGKEVKYVYSHYPDEASTYVIIMLEVLLKYINSDGKLIELLGSMEVPFDAKSFAYEFSWMNITEEDVTFTIDIFSKLGFFDKDENGIIYIPNFSDFVGSEKEPSKRTLYRNDAYSNDTKLKELAKMGIELDVKIGDKSVTDVTYSDTISVTILNRFNNQLTESLDKKFLDFWYSYPTQKRDPSHAKLAFGMFVYKTEIEKVSAESLIESAKLYTIHSHSSDFDKRALVYPESFLGKNKYKNYSQSEKKVVRINTKKTNKFNDFKQNDYDFEELERSILSDPISDKNN